MKTALLLSTARRLAARSASSFLLQRAAPSLSMRAAAPVAVRSLQTTTTRAFSSKKFTPKGDGSSSDSSSSDSDSEDLGSDDDVEDAGEDEEDEDEEEDEEETEDSATYRAAKNAAFTPEDLERFEAPDHDWDDEKKWGKVDSEDWQGFTGDLDAVTEEGVPVWLQSVRDLSEEHNEKRMRAKLLRRAMEEAKMNVPRFRKVDAQGRAYGTGRRKTSTARVWLKKSATPFDGTIKINKKDLTDYFVRDTHREDVLKPFVVVSEIGNFDVYATVAGGGLTGQAGAVRHGIARALQLFDPAMRPPLKKEKLLTRDPRAVERKKPGQKKARKKFQWVKR